MRVFSKSTCLHGWACCSCTGPVLLKSHAESSSIYTRRGVRFVAVCCNFPCVGSTGQSQRSKSSFRIQRSPRAELVAAVTSRGPSSAVETFNAARHMSGGAYDIQPDRRIRHLTDVLTKGPRTFDAVVIGAGTRSETVEAAQACLRTPSCCEWLCFLPCGRHLYRQSTLLHLFRMRRCRGISNMQSFSGGRTESHPIGASQCNWHRNKFAE